MSMNVETEKKETEKNKIVIIAYHDKDGYYYTLSEAGPFKELVREYLKMKGAKYDEYITEWYGEWTGNYFYYVSKEPIEFDIFCNVSIIWKRTYIEFVESSEFFYH